MKTASSAPSQRETVIQYLRVHGMARLSELTALGVTAAAVSRLEKEGTVVRLARGLYQLPDAPLHVHQTLAEASKLVPNGVICLTSALAFHGLTDQLPSKVWLAIGLKDWRPKFEYPPVRFVRFDKERLTNDIEQHLVDGVTVPIFGIARTIADLFRYRVTVGDNVAVEGLREGLRQRRVSPSEIAQQATKAKIWKTIEPYLTALTSNA